MNRGVFAMSKLTDKQRMFADYYIQTANATESYMKAYNPKNPKSAESAGARLLGNVKVQNYIKEKMEELSTDRIAKAEEVLEFLTAILRGEIKEEVPLTKMNELGIPEQKLELKQVSAKDRIKSAELLGKRYRLFVDKVELDGSMSVIFEGEDELEE